MPPSASLLLNRQCGCPNHAKDTAAVALLHRLGLVGQCIDGLAAQFRPETGALQQGCDLRCLMEGGMAVNGILHFKLLILGA